MEEFIIAAMFSLQGLFWATMFVLLIYFIFKRVKDKKEETFEQRDN